MTQASCKTTIHAPADAVWQVIGDFGAACPYLARVVNCTVEGEGVGAQRTLTSADGSMTDLEVGRRVEVLYVDDRRKDTADWIKVVVASGG